ncbi:MAG: hypothetical protein RLZZ350_126 [Verrucomicrobiota bacterium]|jgi:Flp pilus assembly protein TadD
MSKHSQTKFVRAAVPPVRAPLSRDWFIAAWLALGVVVLFWPMLGFDYVFVDDAAYVIENPEVQAGLTWHGLVWAFTTVHASNWHPLTWLSHMTDVTLFSAKPWGAHLTNLLLHAANTALLFALLRKITGAVWCSVIVAVLFAVHPLHVESVAWVSERKDVLSTFFGLLTLLCYAGYASKVERRASKAGLPFDPRPSTLDYRLALLFFTLGLLSKPMLVTWPCVMLLLDFWPLRRFQLSTFNFQLFLEKIPFFALSAAACAATVFAQGNGGAIISVARLPLAARLANVCQAYARYLGKTFWPTSLSVFYPPIEHPAWAVSLAVLLLVGVSALAVWWARRRPYFLVGWFLFLGVLVPVIGLVQVGGQSMADRYAYVPLVGIFIIVVWGANELRERWPGSGDFWKIATVVTLVASTVTMRRQLVLWHDNDALFSHALAVTKKNWLAASGCGSVLYARGETEAAIRLYRECLAVEPDYTTARSNLGMALSRVGRYEEAVVEFRTVLKIMEDPWVGHNNLAIALGALGRTDESFAEYALAKKVQPTFAGTYLNFGTALSIKGRLAEAEQNLREAVRLDPTSAAAHKSLGVVFAKTGRRTEAMAEFTEALRLKPDLQDAAVRLRELQVQTR